jgi:hypothetical protein
MDWDGVVAEAIEQLDPAQFALARGDGGFGIS